jgi:hypothetical protein
MQQSQIQIFGKVLPEKTFNITLVTSDNNYTLLESSREIIDKIKCAITPTDWDYPFIMVSNTEWDAILKSDTEETQPLYGVILNNTLYIYPTPSSAYNGDVIQLIVFRKAPATTLSDSIDPELAEVFDKDIEWLTLFSFTGDIKWWNLYEESINKKIHLASQRADEDYTVKELEW